MLIVSEMSILWGLNFLVFPKKQDVAVNRSTSHAQYECTFYLLTYSPQY